MPKFFTLKLMTCNLTSLCRTEKKSSSGQTTFLLIAVRKERFTHTNISQMHYSIYKTSGWLCGGVFCIESAPREQSGYRALWMRERTPTVWGGGESNSAFPSDVRAEHFPRGAPGSGWGTHTHTQSALFIGSTERAMSHSTRAALCIVKGAI